MSKVFDHFNGMQPDQEAMDRYVRRNGGVVIKTVRDEIFTDYDESIVMDTEETICLHQPLANGEFADRVDINPNFIVSITYHKP
jgi:hypothetical protein